MLRAGGRKNVNGTEKLPFLFDNFIICKFKIFQSFSMQLIQFYPMIIAPIKYSKVMFWNTEEHHSCTNNYAHCFSTSLNAIWIIRIIIQLSSHLELHFFDQHWCPSKLLPPLLLLFAPWKLLSSHTAFNYSAIYHIGSFSSELWANVLRSAPITHAVHSFNWSFVCLFTHSQTPSLPISALLLFLLRTVSITRRRGMAVGTFHNIISLSLGLTIAARQRVMLLMLLLLLCEIQRTASDHRADNLANLFSHF